PELNNRRTAPPVTPMSRLSALAMSTPLLTRPLTKPRRNGGPPRVEAYRPTETKSLIAAPLTTASPMEHDWSSLRPGVALLLTLAMISQSKSELAVLRIQGRKTAQLVPTAVVESCNC